MEIEFLGEKKFARELSRTLAYKYNYRVDLNPEQFASQGFGERKMVLLLDIYGLLKQARKDGKVNKRLTLNVDKKWQHPCD